MRDDWLMKLDTDPFACAFIEISKDGTKAYLTYKSPIDYHDIEFTAANKIEYIIFAPKKLKDKKGVLSYRVVDDVMDYIVYVDGDKYTLVDELSFSHPTANMHTVSINQILFFII